MPAVCNADSLAAGGRTTRYAELGQRTLQGAGGGAPPSRECAKLACLMKLYTTPPSILTLVTWVQRTQACTLCSLACRWRLHSALRADRESFSIESSPLLDSKALCRQLRVVYSAVVINISSGKKKNEKKHFIQIL